jgi:hypothetical protein
MKNARPLLAIAVSTVLAAFTPSAQADEPEPQRYAGIGLSVSPLAIEPVGDASIGGVAEPASGLPDDIEYSLPGLMMAATSVPLVLIGVPLWASSYDDELGPTEVELGVGLSSLALRGSF